MTALRALLRRYGWQDAAACAAVAAALVFLVGLIGLTFERPSTPTPRPEGIRTEDLLPGRGPLFAQDDCARERERERREKVDADNNLGPVGTALLYDMDAPAELVPDLPPNASILDGPPPEDLAGLPGPSRILLIRGWCLLRDAQTQGAWVPGTVAVLTHEQGRLSGAFAPPALIDPLLRANVKEFRTPPPLPAEVLRIYLVDAERVGMLDLPARRGAR